LYLNACLYEVASRDSIPSSGWDIYFLRHVHKLSLPPEGQGFLPRGWSIWG